MSDEKRCLAVIDMLVDFVDEKGSLYCGPSARGIIGAIELQVREARDDGVPVFFICDDHRPDDPEFKLFPPHCIAGTPGAEVIRELRPFPGDRIVRKRRYSAFFGTDFDLSLREMGISRLVLTGVCTNICVLYTAADAVMRGYSVTVVENGVASFDSEAHEAALKEMKRTLGVSFVRSDWTAG